MKTDFAPFLAWCQSKGISTPLQLVTSSTDSRYRYLALPKDPQRLLKSPSSNHPDALLNIIQAPLEACLTGEDWPTLVEKLQYHVDQGDDSDYAPWLSLFPTMDDLVDMPRFWQNSSNIHNAFRQDWFRQYDGGQLETRMQEDQYRFDQCRHSAWALACVDSRSNFLPDHSYGMTPLLDMLNHDPTIPTSARVDGASRLLLGVSGESVLHGKEGKQEENWWGTMMDSFTGGGKSKTKDPYSRAGREVYVSYGDFDNLETLCNYGFVNPHNPCNVETFFVRLLGKNTPVRLVVDTDGNVDNLYNGLPLTELRVALATAQELEDLKERETQWDGMTKLSDRNELETFALVAGELEEALSDTAAGIQAAHQHQDVLAGNYLLGRQRTLAKGRDWLKKRFPEVF